MGDKYIKSLLSLGFFCSPSRRWLLVTQVLFLFFVLVRFYGSLAYAISNVVDDSLSNFSSSSPSSSSTLSVVAGADMVSKKRFNLLFISIPMSLIEGMLCIAKAMEERGHEVSFISLDAAKKKVEKLKLPFYSGGEAYTYDYLSNYVEHAQENGFFEWLSVFADMMNTQSDRLADGLHKYLATNRKPDIAIVGGGIGPLSLLRKLDIPYVITFPTLFMSPAFNSLIYLPSTRTAVPLLNKTLQQRLITAGISFIYNYITPYTHGYPIEIMDPSYQNKVLRIVATVPGFDFPAHSSPLVKFVGPLVNHVRLGRENIGKDVYEWMHIDNSKYFLDNYYDNDDYHSEDEKIDDMQYVKNLPIVYVSMGTFVIMSEKTSKIFIDGLLANNNNDNKSRGKKREWRVLWALNERQWKTLPSYVFTDKNIKKYIKIVDWATTPAILADKKVKIFFTHCGGNSVDESLLSATPMVGLPHYGDQFDVCARVQTSGTGEVFLNVKPHELPPEKLSNAIHKILHNYEFYEKNAQKLSVLCKTYGGVDTAARWIELAAEWKGDLTMLSTPVEIEGITKSFNLDILVYFFIFAVFMSFLMGITFAKCIAILRRRRKNKDEKNYGGSDKKLN